MEFQQLESEREGSFKVKGLPITVAPALASICDTYGSSPDGIRHLRSSTIMIGGCCEQGSRAIFSTEH
jgi:hypothetical protein